MATIKKEISVSGKTLMTGKTCAVNIFPSKEKQIRFYLEGSEKPFTADPFNVISTDNCTVLGNNSATEKVMLIEHFMAACAFANLDSLDVCLSYQELPIFDGSSLKWFELFNEAGVEEEISPKTELKEPVFYSDKNSCIAVIPADEFKVTYCIDFRHPDLKNKWMNFDLNSNKNQIIEARTFGYLKDLEKFQQMGLALGVDIENIVGLTDDGYTTDSRSESEPLKHKILDLIGDLSLLHFNPLNLKAHIIAKEVGHKSHVEIAKKIAQQFK